MITTNETSHKPTVLAVGFFIPGTGFTRVFDSLFAHLSEYYAIHWMGIGYRGDSVVTEHYTLHPVNKNGGDAYGAYGAAEMAERLSVKTILVLNDFFMLKNYERTWQPLKQKGVRLLAYVPIDGYFNDTAFVKNSLFFDHLVLYGKWAMEEVKTAVDKFVTQNEAAQNIPQLHSIFHGVDVHTFQKRVNGFSHNKIFNGDHPDDAVFILNANRNAERKDIDTTLRAFQKALPGFRRPAYLCLHMPGTDEMKRTLLFKKIEDLSLTQWIIYNPLGEGYVSNEELCHLYQACAIGINTSLGEGWGLVSFEHAACGAAQLVPDHTSPGELWKDAGILIPRTAPIQLDSNPFLMYKVDEDELARQLVLLVNDEAYLDNAREKCFQFSQEKRFSWSVIAEKWRTIM